MREAWKLAIPDIPARGWFLMPDTERGIRRAQVSPDLLTNKNVSSRIPDVLRQVGYDVGETNGRLWFALPSDKTPVLDWIDLDAAGPSDQLQSILQDRMAVEKAWSEKMSVEIGDKRWRDAQRSEDVANEEWLYALEGALTSCAPEFLAERIKAEFWPKFCERYPGGTWKLIVVHPAAVRRASALRALFTARWMPSIFELPAEQFPGFSTLRHWHPGLSVGLEPYLVSGLQVFAPDSYGVYVSRPTFGFLILFGKRLSQHGQFPRELGDLCAPARVKASQAEGGVMEGTRYHWSSSQDEVLAFLKWWVERVSARIRNLIDPAEFVDKLGTFDPTENLFASLTLEELCLDISQCFAYLGRDEWERKRVGFRILDVLEGMGYPGTSSNNASRGFKSFFTNATVVKACERWRDIQPSLGHQIAKRIEDSYEAVLKEVRSGLLDRSREFEKYMKMSWGNVTWEEYAVWLFRGLRNTVSHSYEGQRIPESLEALAIHNGSVSDRLPEFAALLGMLAVAEPAALK